MNAEADLNAVLTVVLSSTDHPDECGDSVRAPASCCRNLLAGLAASDIWLSDSVSNPLRRMKSSRERADCVASCAALHGSSFRVDLTAISDHESLSVLKFVPSPLSSCFASTVSADFMFSIAWMLSTSVLWNSLSCFSRSSIASFNAALSSATSLFSSSMRVFKPSLFAVKLSIEASSSSTLASWSEIAFVFSKPLSLHQQRSLS
mmetsp:Transcript_24828/g.78190  ORF Transcript_24828/g.78190 Transcript_24828/m.78190 type:complete len:205 (+) Transcript_24828:1513-2127(+)